MQPLSNYPRTTALASIDLALLAQRTKRILFFEVCLAIGNFTLSVFSELFMSQAEAAILFGGLAWFVAFIFLWFEKSKWVKLVIAFLAEMNNEEPRISIRSIGFWSGFPIIGPTVFGYVLDYCLTRSHSPVLSGMKWYSVKSILGLGTAVVYCGAIYSSFMILDFAPENVSSRITWISDILNIVFVIVLVPCLIKVQAQIESMVAKERHNSSIVP